MVGVVGDSAPGKRRAWQARRSARNRRRAPSCRHRRCRARARSPSRHRDSRARTCSVPSRPSSRFRANFPVEQALLGGEQRALAIDVDRAAFEHDGAMPSPSRARGRNSRSPSQPATRRPARVVLEMVRIASPAVEAKLDGRDSLARDLPFAPRTSAANRASRSDPCRRGRNRRAARSTWARSSTRRARRSSAALRTITRTRSPRVSWRAISANTQGIAANFPGQSVGSCGQASQVAAVRLPLRRHAKAERGGAASHRVSSRIMRSPESSSRAVDPARKRRCGDRGERASCAAPLPLRARSQSTTSISSPSPASASTTPNGSPTNE